MIFIGLTASVVGVLGGTLGGVLGGVVVGTLGGVLRGRLANFRPFAGPSAFAVVCICVRNFGANEIALRNNTSAVNLRTPFIFTPMDRIVVTMIQVRGET